MPQLAIKLVLSGACLELRRGLYNRVIRPAYDSPTMVEEHNDHGTLYKRREILVVHLTA